MTREGFNYKECIRCKTRKELSEFGFSTRRKDRCQTRCKKCNVEVVREWQKVNKEKVAANQANCRKNRKAPPMTPAEFTQLITQICSGDLGPDELRFGVGRARKWLKDLLCLCPLKN